MFERDPLEATIGKEILSFETSDLTNIFQEKAEVELQETLENRVQGIKQMKEMIKNDGVLQDMFLNEDFMLMFLRARKYEVNKALMNLKRLIELQINNPHMFRNMQFVKTVKVMTEEMAVVLPWRCQDGCAIIYIKLDNWHPDKFPMEEVQKAFIVIFLQALRNPMTQVNGFKIIYNPQTKSFRHLKHLTAQNLYLFLHATLRCFPARYKAIHVINNSFVAKTGWRMIKSFVPEKIRNRIHFHSSQEELLKYFPKVELPVECGGTLVKHDMTNWLKKMMQPEELELMMGRTCSHDKLNSSNSDTLGENCDAN